MRLAFGHVKAFHRVTDQLVSREPLIPSKEDQLLRFRLIMEEYDELVLAMGFGKVEGIYHTPGTNAEVIANIAKEAADLIYVVLGTCAYYGINIPLVWEEVHLSNMHKVNHETGRVERREDGKVLKPDGWIPPDIHSIIKENDIYCYTCGIRTHDLCDHGYCDSCCVSEECG